MPSGRIADKLVTTQYKSSGTKNVSLLFYIPKYAREVDGGKFYALLC